MPYTIWSRGRLLGTSNLDYARSLPGLRAGDFEPTEVGERLLPIITGVGPALRGLYRLVHAERASGRASDEDLGAGFPERIRKTTEYADAVSVGNELESLALELRDPDGAVVPTDSIAVQDTEYLLSLGREGGELYEELADDEALAASEMFGDDETFEEDEDVLHDIELLRDGFDDDEDDDEPWRPPRPFPRYQLFITLEGTEALLASPAPGTTDPRGD